MKAQVSPLQDLTKAHSILESCYTEPQLDGALNYFELVIQKWETLLSVESVQAFRQEFADVFWDKKTQFKIE